MCTAGGAYIPTMSDEAVIVQDIGFLYLGGNDGFRSNDVFLHSAIIVRIKCATHCSRYN